jgi:hypothetical protein
VTNTKHIPTFCPASILVKKNGLREQSELLKVNTSLKGAEIEEININTKTEDIIRQWQCFPMTHYKPCRENTVL